MWLPTGADVLDSLLVDLAAALLPSVDVRRSAFCRLQLVAGARSLQLPLGHEVPGQAVFDVVGLQAAIVRQGVCDP